MKIINQDIPNLILGASLLSAGGGLSYQEQLKNYHRLVKDQADFEIKLVNISDLPQNSFLTVCGESGPTNLSPLNKKSTGKLVLELERISRKKISGLLPLEIGQEMIVLETAHYSQLPVVDADMAGGRAVPMVYLTLPFLLGFKFDLSPVVAVNNQGVVKVLKQAKSLESIDNFLDKFSQESQGIIFFLSGVLATKKIKKYVNAGSYASLIKLGNNKNLKKINKGLFKIIKIEKIQKDVSLIQKTTLKNNQDELIVLSQNEYLSVYSKHKNKVIYQAPEIISLVDIEGGYGINSGDNKKQMMVNLYVFEPIKPLSTTRVKLQWEKYIKNLFKNL